MSQTHLPTKVLYISRLLMKCHQSSYFIVNYIGLRLCPCVNSADLRPVLLLGVLLLG